MRTSFSCLAAMALAQGAVATLINGIYYDQWHTADLPGKNATAGINHAFVAFIQPEILNTDPPGDYTPFTSVASMKEMFGNGTKVLISVGGWGAYFNVTAATETSRALFAKNVAKMLADTGADGVDIDWEYPGGNGADYLIVKNEDKVSEIETYPLLLEAVRDAIGPSKLLTIAVPGKEVDMIAYTAETVPRIAAACDFFNLMTYDLMNRRDKVTKHHSDVAGSLATVDAYIARGLEPSKIVLGFAYYAKWFTTATNSTCAINALGCATAPMEDEFGTDLGLQGAMTFEKVNMVVQPLPTNMTVSPDGSCGATAGYRCAPGFCCSQWGFCGNEAGHCGTGCTVGFGDCTGPSVMDSWQKALTNGIADTVNGGQYYWDSAMNLFWTWDTPEFIAEKFEKIVKARSLAGVMAWSLGEDTYDNKMMLAVQAGVKNVNYAPTYRRNRGQR